MLLKYSLKVYVAIYLTEYCNLMKLLCGLMKVTLSELMFARF